MERRTKFNFELEYSYTPYVHADVVDQVPGAVPVQLHGLPAGPGHQQADLQTKADQQHAPRNTKLKSKVI